MTKAFNSILLFVTIAFSSYSPNVSAQIHANDTIGLIRKLTEIASSGRVRFGALVGAVAIEAIKVRDLDITYYNAQLEFPNALQTRMLHLANTKPPLYCWSAIMGREEKKNRLQDGQIFDSYKRLLRQITVQYPSANKLVIGDTSSLSTSRELRFTATENGHFTVGLEAYHDLNRKRNTLRLFVVPDN